MKIVTVSVNLDAITDPIKIGKGKGGVLKVKKWGNGSMNDKGANWRNSRCPWEHHLHESWKARGGGMRQPTKKAA